MNEKVNELVKWVAREIWYSLWDDQQDWERLDEYNRGIYINAAKQALSHPDLALIDSDYIPTRLGDADKEFRGGWKYGQESLIKQNYYPVIPLAEALKESLDAKT